MHDASSTSEEPDDHAEIQRFHTMTLQVPAAFLREFITFVQARRLLIYVRAASRIHYFFAEACAINVRRIRDRRVPAEFNFWFVL